MDYKFDDNVPIYLQIIQLLKTDIIAGKYQPNDKLPPVRDLAEYYGVNPNTVQRAYSELEREEIVVSDRTNGRYVSSDKKQIKKMLETLSKQYIDELFNKLNQLGLSDEQIIKQISKGRNKK